MVAAGDHNTVGIFAKERTLSGWRRVYSVITAMSQLTEAHSPCLGPKPEADGRGKKLCHEFMAHVWNFFSTMQVSSTVRTNEESDLLVPVVEHVSSLQKMVCPYFFVQLYGQYSQFPNRGRPSNVVWHLCASRGYDNPWQDSSSLRETHSMDRVSFFAFEYTIY